MMHRSHNIEGDCVFCKIVSGEITTPGVFWENEKYMAFLSIFPNTKGFSVVIPKKHWASDVMALPDNELQQFILAAKTVSQILTNYFDDVGRVGVIMEGMGVDHAHIKLMPMHGTEYLKRGEWKVCSSETKYFEKYDGFLCSNDGPKADEDEIKKLAEGLKEIAELTT